MAIKKGDNVIVLSGKDRGKKGKVLRAIPQEGRILVDGVNISKRHQRSRREGKKGEIVSKPMPIRVSAAALFCSACGKGMRHRAKLAGDKKLRVCVRCSAEL